MTTNSNEEERSEREVSDFKRFGIVHSKIAIDFSFRAITRLVNVLRSVQGCKYVYLNEIPYNGKTYEIKYEDHAVSFECVDGRKLECYFFPDSNFFKATYDVPGDDSIIFMNKKIGQENDSEITPFDLANGLDFLYVSTSPDFVTTIHDINYYKVEGKSISFDEDSISFEGYEVSLDGKNLLKNGQLIGSFEKIDSLPRKSTVLREKIKKNVQQGDSILYSLSDMDLDTFIDGKEDKFFTEDELFAFKLQDFSKIGMPVCRKVIEIRNNLMNGYIGSTLSGDEINILTDIFADSLNSISEKTGGVQKAKREGLN